MFSTLVQTETLISLWFASAFNLGLAKILSKGNELTHSQTMTPFDAPRKKFLENIVGKGEIAHNEQFLLFPVFSTGLNNFLPFSSNFRLSSAKSFNLEEPKILSMGNELNSTIDLNSHGIYM